MGGRVSGGGAGGAVWVAAGSITICLGAIVLGEGLICVQNRRGSRGRFGGELGVGEGGGGTEVRAREHSLMGFRVPGVVLP